MKKRIVCFGDSNTWGYDAGSDSRYDDHIRWTGVLADTLGDGYTIIEEGQNGRTTVWDDPVEGFKNGMTYLLPCLETAAPFDLLIIMLGTNDLKSRFAVTARDIAQSAARLAKTALSTTFGRGKEPPKVLLVSPIELGDIAKSPFGEMFLPAAIETSKRFPYWFEQYAQEIGCPWLNAAQYAEPDPADQLHITREGHAALGKAIAAKAKELIG